MNKYLLTLSVLFLVASTGFAQSDAPAQVLAGGDWNQWRKDKKIAFVEGFVSGSHWVASNSILPASLFPNETVRTRAQTIWEQAKNEFGKVIANPKMQLPRHEYTAADIILYGMFDGYKKNELYERAIIKLPTQTLVDRINQLYADSVNLKVPIDGAIYLAKKIANGTSENDVNTLLPYLRGDKPPPPGWIIPVYDKTGKYIKVIEFP